MISLDANVVLRYILRDLPAQSAKAEALITRSQCYVSDVIVTETAFVLERRFGLSRADVSLILRKFLSLRTVACNELLLDKTLELFASARRLSFADCYAAAEASRGGHILVTFDKDLARYGGSHVSEP